MSVKGRYAVLLTKNSDFIKVKNKNYSVGDKVKIPHYKGQILAAAASFIVVCGGISSYFVPAKYMSVDINPGGISFLLPPKSFELFGPVGPLKSGD